MVTDMVAYSDPNLSFDSVPDSAKDDIHYYVNNIKEFYKRNDKETLTKLTDLIHNWLQNSLRVVKTGIQNNISFLYHENVITQNEYEELLKFHLFLLIMTNIQHNNGQRVYILKRRTKEEQYLYPIIVDGEQYYVKESDKNGDQYEELFKLDICQIIRMSELVDILIGKHFVLDNPNTWISKKELASRIKNYIEEMCNEFDKLPVINNNGNNNNIKTYNKIPCRDAMDKSIYKKIDEYFSDYEVREKLIQELKKVFNNKKVDKMYDKFQTGTDIKSKAKVKDIFSYLSLKKKHQLAGHQKFNIDHEFPPGLFDDSNGIPAIVLSYLKNDLLRGYTGDIPERILRYIRKYNILPI